MMKITSLNIPDLLLIEPCILEDSRGYFFESFREDLFKKKILSDIYFVQDNHVKSSHGVLRGLHYQLPPRAQDKLVRVTQGEVLDVAVDLRKSSSTFGKYVAEILSSENKKQLYIPKGFAHGYITLSETSEFLYKVSDFYSPKDERCILWNDAILDIDWPKNIDIQLSPKDLMGQTLNLTELFP